MANLSSLLRKLETLHRQQHELAQEITGVEKQIVEAANEHKPRTRSTKAELIALVRETVNVLRAAGGKPLPRTEIAARLGISPTAVSYRLQKALKMNFVERADHGFYRATATVTAI